MTAALALLALVGPSLGLKVLEAPEESPNVVVQAVVRAAPLETGYKRAVWRVLAEALWEGTSQFTTEKMRSYGQQAGVPMLINPGDGFIRIQIVEPENGYDVAAQILESLVEEARLSDEGIAKAKERLQSRITDPWVKAVNGPQPDVSAVKPEAVRELYRLSFQPANLLVVVAGAFEPGAPAKDLGRRFPARPAPRPERWREAESRLVAPDLESHEIRLGEPGDIGPNGFVAAYALGTGQGSLLHEVLREDMGRSYRQEAVLWPTAQGFSLRLVWAGPAKGGEVLEALRAKRFPVEATIARALNLAEASLRFEGRLSPVWLDARSPWSGGLADRAALLALSSLGSQPKPIQIEVLRSAGPGGEDIEGALQRAKVVR
ncbi:MAG: insulinase family protein [Fimbriimonadaceae bacterium]|nr:insulinase family protein [Fimbriimonadaceae bacterium]QYK54875.1 MAG: insulinase family protein [Fimbriimonadaceae bacterium]